MIPAPRLLLLALATVLLGGCQALSGPQGDGQPPRLQRILTSGELRVGVSGNQPPLNMKSRTGSIIGLEIELVQALASSMGLRAAFVQKPFAELLPALEGGEVDLVISGMTITPERNARVAFAGPYLISGKSVLSKSKRIASVETPGELDNPSRSYAALAGSTSEAFVRDILPRARLVPTRDYDDAVALVLGDEVDAMVADYPICALSVLRHPEAGLSMLTTPFTLEPLGIALPAGDPLFVNLVENYLSTLEGTGLLTQLKAKWFSDGSWVAELP
jgi:polar amino acid transport system substrate-binding protein